MTTEAAITYFEKASEAMKKSGGFEYTIECTNEALRAMRKMIAVKPVLIEEPHDIHSGEEKVCQFSEKEIHCPVCNRFVAFWHGETIEYAANDMNYCWHCGQKLDWSEYDD